jgi:SAM-dependent methyltransferase
MNSTQKNIYTDGTYLKNNPAWGLEDSSRKAAEIYSLILKNKLMVHHLVDVGCGAGSIVHELSQMDKDITKIRGYDISADAISMARKFESDRIEFINADFFSLETEMFDLLLMIDVLEHVEDYYCFLRSLKTRAKHFVFHIPLDLSCRTLLKPHVLLQQRESVGHLHYFSKEMVFWLLKDLGYEMIDWKYTKPDVDIKKPASFKQWLKKVLRKISFSISQSLSDKLWGNFSIMILAKQHE